MDKFDYYFQEDIKITGIGKRIVDNQNNYYLKCIRRNIKNGKKKIKLLEIGPGKGYFTTRCQEENDIEYHAIEANKKQVLRMKNKGFNVLQGVVPPIEVEDSSYQAVVMYDVLEHMPNKKKAVFLVREIKRILKKDGVLVLTAPDCNIWKDDFQKLDKTHTYYTTLSRVEKLLYNNGYSIEYQGYICGPFKSRFSTFVMSKLIRSPFFNLAQFFLPFVQKRQNKIRSSLQRDILIVAIPHQ